MLSDTELQVKKSTSQQRRNALAEQFMKTRNMTLELVDPLQGDDFVVQTAPFTSPPKWHIGHVSWIYEAIMSKLDKSYKFYSTEFSEYLNLYYQQFGIPHDKKLRGIVSRPTTDEIFKYFENVSRQVTEFIGSSDLFNDKDAARLITMGMHHESQH